MLPALNIVGPGKVGRTLAALWRHAGAFAIQDVLSSTPDGARAAVCFIGAGHAAAHLEDMRPADVWMLTTPDDGIPGCAAGLARSGLLRIGDLVFHCSGALSSLDLQPAAVRGAHVASVHPVKSFAEPATALSEFAGIWCAAEGDAAALALLEPAFERIGGRVTRIDAKSKLVYHAGNVIVSNYLVALVEAALRCYARAGISRDQAMEMMEPLVRDTVSNLTRLGTVQALTGPIARGDAALVSRQLSELEKADARLAALYRQLGAFTVQLARGRGEASAAALDAIQRLLGERPDDAAAP